MKETKCYEAEDGTQFKNRYDCLRHDQGLEILKFLIDKGFVSDGPLKRIALALANDETGTFLDIASEIRKINTNERK